MLKHSTPMHNTSTWINEHEYLLSQRFAINNKACAMLAVGMLEFVDMHSVSAIGRSLFTDQFFLDLSVSVFTQHYMTDN